ncbi:A-kinase anchor protein 1, mitochondrial-like [Diorhabda carinulata]|uniref:A-kinase anchor protein 1, mitochondrial-like n=1 Tax=Diorhabda carinulata TaxID=1163345 RepID=UPI0025A24EC3|nr:A-kinase anchor protein 1, mitochondrial-like [Diorhabda carinulata]XP_057653882.1 A-kinase anchor protein 1, mitochondrial-like [Diorhabda carinulata]
MAPYHSRQLLVWTLPTVAVLLSYLWFKKKRIGPRSDPGDKSTSRKEEIQEKSLFEELNEAEPTIPTASSTPNKSFSRSLSGVESSPIDIVIPPELRATKTTPRVVSDEDLDLEIEKIKSMKNGHSFSVKTDSPADENICSKAKKNQKKESGKMAQKDMAIVEEKLTTLKIGKNKECPKKREQKNTERDSANHSPSDVMLASPSLSSISDNHSEGSSDSGKGGSDVATPPPSRTPNIDVTATLPTFYEFVIPQSLVGKLIGRNGSFVSQIRNTTNVSVIVRAHPNNNKMKICSIEGATQQIETALKMIRDKFPSKRYPEVTLEQIDLTPAPPVVSLIPDYLYLKLVEGINNDTVLSCLVAPNHLFLQQPTHPSFPSLNLLTNCMNACYSQSDSPLIPTPVADNTVCAAYSVNAWYRAIILSSDVQNDTSYIRFLDYGGFAWVENSKLRQIRGDFMLLPFQAAECILANIMSINEDGSWSEDAYNLVADVAKGSIMYTQIADYTEDGIPLVLIYVVVGTQNVICLNEHLVNNGFAQFVPESQPVYEENQVEQADCGVST